MPEPWKVELFSCFDDVPTCLLGWCCPCYLFGKNAEKLDGSNKIGMCFIYATLSSCLLCSIAHRPRRQKLRANYNLEENPNDFVATCFFGSCANCQEARELAEQGVKPDGGAATATRAPVSSQPDSK